MMAESKADYRVEKEACGEHVTSTERWAPEGGKCIGRIAKSETIDDKGSCESKAAREEGGKASIK